MSPILEFRGVSVTYGSEPDRTEAVRDVSLAVEPGDTVGLAGESGCGKTTLALSVLRLLPRSAQVTGEVLLDSRDVSTLSFGELRAARWASASVVFQGAMHALNPVQTIGAQIAEPLKLHAGKSAPSAAVQRQRVEELLVQVELPTSRADSYPHELSGGQKQRVMIAMALACDPRLIIADEPTTALDVVVQAQILALLARLVSERGIALVMISHDLSVLAASCERIAVMYEGNLVEHGPSKQVMTHPQHAHTQALAEAFPVVGDRSFRYAEPHARAGEPLLSAHELAVTFSDRSGRQVRAVRGVDLEVGRDEIVALVGQSGSGKTTLARSLLGLQVPTSGEARFDGTALPRSRAELRAYRRKVQLVLQDPTGALNPRHSVYEAVAEGLRIHGVADDERGRVLAALEAAELRPPEKFIARLPQELSGGQRQRVVIAGALVLEPEVLIADEPVASLDATVRGEILALLLRLRMQRGLSTLVITHDLGLAWNIADRVAVMYQGELVEDGTVEQVLLDPRHDYTRTLLSSVPSLDRRATS